MEIKPLVNRFSKDRQANDYLRLAEDFLTANRGLVFVVGRDTTKKGDYYLYSGGVYNKVSTLEVERMLLDFDPTEPDLKMPKALSEAKQQEVISQIKKLRFFYREMVNPTGIVNLNNGFYYIDKMELKAHTPDVIMTTQLPYGYDPTAKCEVFLKALNHACEGNIEKMAVIQEFAGYCLTKGTGIEKALFLIGAAGSGKSTVLKGFITMLGRANYSGLKMDKICDPRFTGVFVDKLANISTEIPKDIRSYEEALKNAISGEDVTVDTKYVESYTRTTGCKFVFAGNDMPRIADTSDGVYRRLLLIDFNNVIDEDDRDGKIKDQIALEGAGIFNWALEGFRRLRDNGDFTFSEHIKANVEELKLQNNGIYYFMSEMFEITKSDDDYIWLDDMYQEYLNFCHNIGAQTNSHAKSVFKYKNFNKEIRKIYGNKVPEVQRWTGTSSRRCWTHIKRLVKVPTTDIKWDE